MASFHIRSVSLPSASHPLTVSLEEQLHKLKTSQSSSISQKLAGLKELYECLDDFLQLPLTQQTIFNEKLNQSVEEAVNGSLELLDMCGTTRDLFLQMREYLQGLESSLRRRRSRECVFNEVDRYMISRKKLSKVVSKYLKHLKKQEKNCRTTLTNNSELASIIVMLQGVRETSIAVFESILTFISLPKAKSKLSIVSKLIQSKHVSSEDEANEVEKIDSELLILKSNKGINQMQNILKGLESLELSLQEAEEELECVYRRMVKTRVTLLNIVNH